MAELNEIKILLIEDEDFDARRVKNTLRYSEYNIVVKDVVSNGKAALNLLEQKNDFYDLIIMDFQISGGLQGEHLIRKIKEIDNSLEIIVITKMTIDVTDFEFANNLIQAGAYWYCTKYPGNIEDYIYQPTDFILSVVNAYKKRELEKQSRSTNKKLKKSIETQLFSHKIIGESEHITKLRLSIEKYAKSDVSILISGDSGTGKELVAQNIHLTSRRKFEEFVPINCGSIPDDLIESELFGYEKGAFTGANNSKDGLFELADNGTIFLDEVAELPKAAQVKLLRVLQEGEIEKIGRTKKMKVDVRIIAATNKNLEDEVRDGRFREDLYYRLNVVPITVRPLSKREDDVLLLFDYFLDFFAAELNVEKLEITKEAYEVLKKFEWPGNVRQLKNVVQRLLLTHDESISANDVNDSILMKGKEKDAILDMFDSICKNDLLTLNEMDKILRKEYFVYVRNKSASNAEAARYLGLAPPNHHRMSKELGI